MELDFNNLIEKTETGLPRNEWRILGPPGTGKTEYLKRAVEHAALKYNPESIYICSFTRAAAHEIASRIELLPRENVGTLHALCYRMLGRPTIAETKIAEWNELQKGSQRLDYVVGKAQADIDDPMGVEDNKEADALAYKLQDLNFHRNKMVPKSHWKRDLLEFEARWTEWKNANELLDFTDLIEKCSSVPLNRCSLLIVDEAQDLFPLHLRLVRSWAAGIDWLVLAGDDDQCLYEWAGADPGLLVQPSDILARVKILEQSYRIPKLVHELAERISRRIQRRNEKPYQPRESEGSRKWARGVTLNNKGFSAPIIGVIKQKLDTYKSVMLLASAGYMLNSTLKALKEQGIPFHNPYRKSRGDWNPIKPSTKTTISSFDRLSAFLYPFYVPEGKRTDFGAVKHVHKWASLLSKKVCTIPNLDGVVKEIGDEIEDDIIEHLFDNQADRDAACARDIDWLAKSLTAEGRKKLDYPISIHRAGFSLQEPPRLVVGTIHSVKGGEADCVLLSPDLSEKSWADWLLGKRDPIFRVFYVGVTRAREELVILSPSSTRYFDGVVPK